jgi:hypothetical protein
LAHVLDRLSTIFGGYSEWGQPVHEVGNDVRILGLPEKRPDAEHAFRMLCRHNRYVQNFGKIKDLDEISRRERLWLDFVDGIESQSGKPAGAFSADEFRSALSSSLDTDSFQVVKKA